MTAVVSSALPAVAAVEDRLVVTPGKVLVPGDDVYFVVGGLATTVLSVDGENDVLRRVLQAADGRRSQAQVMELAGGSRREVADVIEKLTDAAVLTVVDAGQATEPAAVELQAHMGRRLRSGTGWTADAATAELAAANVAVVGAGEVAASVLTALARFTAPSTQALAPAGAEVVPTLWIAVGEEAFRPSIDAAYDHGVAAVLPVRVLDSDVLAVGPLVWPPSYLCPKCLCDSYEEILDAVVPDVAGGTPGPAATAVFTGVILESALAYLGGLSSAKALASLRVVDLETWSSSQHVVVDRPWCDDGDGGPHAVTDELLTAWTYERLVEQGAPEGRGQTEVSPSAAEVDRWTRLAWHRRDHGPARRLWIDGSTADEDEVDGLWPGDGMSAVLAPDRALALATLLDLSGGIRAEDGRWVQRWAPSPGNLGSSSVHVLLADVEERRLAGYRFDPWTKLLVQSSRPQPVPDGIVLPPLTIVQVVELAAVREKYGAMSFRVALLEAGCQLAHLTAVGTHLGFHLTPAAHWDDEAVRAWLGLDEHTEHVATVLDVADLRGAAG